MSLLQRLKKLEQVKNESEQAKEEALTVLQAQITDLQKEKETLTVQGEEREKAIIEECKRQMEEYINRPWYRKLFS